MTIKISKRFYDRAKPTLKRYQKILESARARDVNESDTVVVVSDFMADVLGYDKYAEITTEFAIRSTFCDLAVKVDGRLHFLIEVKSVGTDLKDNHLRQAIDYGAKQGTEWVVLTNGIVWQAHRIRFEQPIDSDLVFAIDLLDPESRASTMLGCLYLLSRESLSSSDIAKYWAHKEATSRFVLGQLLLTDKVVGHLRREVRRLSKGLKVSAEEIAELLRSDVLKREVLEGEKAAEAASLVRRAGRRRAKTAAAEASGGNDEAKPAEPD